MSLTEAVWPVGPTTDRLTLMSGDVTGASSPGRLQWADAGQGGRGGESSVSRRAWSDARRRRDSSEVAADRAGAGRPAGVAAWRRGGGVAAAWLGPAEHGSRGETPASTALSVRYPPPALGMGCTRSSRSHADPNRAEPSRAASSRVPADCARCAPSGPRGPLGLMVGPVVCSQRPGAVGMWRALVQPPPPHPTSPLPQRPGGARRQVVG